MKHSFLALFGLIDILKGTLAQLNSLYAFYKSWAILILKKEGTLARNVTLGVCGN
jgi:hypothetical protein